jgi:2-hydroxychromene-2-carboxylate isomerase
MLEVEFYFGLGSRYSYFAFTQIARIEGRYPCVFKLLPISSIELMEIRGTSPFQGAPVSGQYDWDYRRRDAKAWADYYKTPFIEPKPLPADHRLMARACLAADLQQALRPYSEAMFQAVFADNLPIGAETCSLIAARLKLDTSRFNLDIHSPLVEARVTFNARRAANRGAFGVPTFFVDDQMFWGNDRLVLVEHWLASHALT